ncbi:MAG: hypothetical protein ACR2QM_06020 [Longimicrobiales bacterium]
MKILAKVTKGGLGAAALALSLMTAACEGGPTAPELEVATAQTATTGSTPASDTTATPPPPVDPQVEDSTAVDTLTLVPRKWPTDHDITKSKWIGPDGGYVNIGATGFELEVPAGALTEMTEITVTALAGEYELYQFGPHGIQFEVPVKMHFAVESVHVARLLVEGAEGVYLGEGDDPEVLETFPLENSGLWVLFEATHFSRYAMAFQTGYALAW